MCPTWPPPAIAARRAAGDTGVAPVLPEVVVHRVWFLAGHGPYSITGDLPSVGIDYDQHVASSQAKVTIPLLW